MYVVVAPQPGRTVPWGGQVRGGGGWVGGRCRLKQGTDHTSESGMDESFVSRDGESGTASGGARARQAACMHAVSTRSRMTRALGRACHTARVGWGGVG